MRAITVDKARLVETLTANMAEHSLLYEQAMVKYKEKVQEWFEQNLALIVAGDYAKLQRACPYPVPEEHTDDYQRALDMLSWDLGTTYELTEEDFQSYIDNDWRWGRTFFANTTSYLVEEAK